MPASTEHTTDDEHTTDTGHTAGGEHTAGRERPPDTGAAGTAYTAEPPGRTGRSRPTPFDAWERRAWAGRGRAYADSYAAACAYPAEPLLDAVGAGRGTRLLDAGCGPGVVAALAAGRGARVTAVDAEPSMLALAARRVPGAGVLAALLPHLPFPDGAFDVAAGNFVINHVGRPVATVAELRRVTRPGGRVALTIWPQPPSGMQQFWLDVMAAAGLRAPAGLPTVAEEENFDRTRAGFAGLLRAGGLTAVTCRRLDWELRVDPERWWHGPLHGLGALGRILPRLDPVAQAEVRRHYDRLIDRRRTPDGLIALPTGALLATGAVPTVLSD
ncbi:class I SAM-dependent methyltransferase [Plantactinospora sp. KBS50]|uniref:class I SAM-dependent methyltransferase n=1 Tax=Plantactinospora sp. KBS50 TaxID=2024580 RepID=UPI000BAAC51B|nr:class I SAM-dependent methyltransferase [Plantactinospora sp. KBS50]ASW57827.1 hypothetical protein CIK06_18940 [Plantactinospora sp. KBS50]